MVTTVCVCSPSATVQDVHEVKHTYGFSGVPITADGVLGSKLLGRSPLFPHACVFVSLNPGAIPWPGFVGSRDIDFGTNPEASVTEVMTKFEDLVVARDDISLSKANEILRHSKKGCVLQPRVSVVFVPCALTGPRTCRSQQTSNR